MTDDLHRFFGAGSLPAEDILIRLGLAVLFGMIIGIDRELRDKPAGLRTHGMISLAACSLTILSFAFFEQLGQDAEGADPIRALEAVVTGVAFLGAGAIIQSRGDVQGITTGSGMWLAGAAGLACGGGFFFLAALTTVFGVVLLVLFGLVERHLLGKRDPAETAKEPRRGTGG